MGGLCSWVVTGFIAGLIARAIMPGSQRLGIMSTTLLGMAGSLVGGFLGSLLSRSPWQGMHRSTFLGAIVGALVILFIGEVMAGRRSRR
jgi:uncharacterized membrane protein YeaQ/YmgE (transglycosylase-associated protein family)